MNRLRPPRVLLVLLALVLAAATGNTRAQTPEEIFDRGNSAYEAGRFDEAAEAFRRVLRYGIQDARVDYNLANAEFKQGRLGEAILHYRRALRLDPIEQDIRSNLKLVESYLADQVDSQEPAAALGWWRGFQDRIGPDRHAIAFLFLVWLVAGLIGWCSARPGGWNATAGWTLAALLLLLVLCGGSWRTTYQRLEGKELAVVLADSVEVLAGPGSNNATLFTVHEGLTVEVRADREGWLQVSLPNGLSGWLSRESVGLV